MKCGIIVIVVVYCLVYLVWHFLCGVVVLGFCVYLFVCCLFLSFFIIIINWVFFKIILFVLFFCCCFFCGG